MFYQSLIIHTIIICLLFIIKTNGVTTEITKKMIPSSRNHNHRYKRAAVAKQDRLWTNGIIPYEIDLQFGSGHKALFIRAMRHWENKTCITFVERRRNQHPNYILFTVRECGCCSYVGKQTGIGGQTISIGKNCDKFGIVVHELGHVIGLWHEHTRPDRDDHIVIAKDNIIAGHENNFNKLTTDDVNSLGLAYDFHSIMHYARNTFSKGSYLDTIFPRNESTTKRSELGQRLHLSTGDIQQVNLLYACPICGQTLQHDSGTFSSLQLPVAANEKCQWRITATHGERISLNITNLNIFKSPTSTKINECNGNSNYLEIRDGYDSKKSMLLAKLCGSTRPREIWSTGSRLTLTLYRNSVQSDAYFSANYKIICGGSLNVKHMTRVTSPNYPLDYLPNKECIWNITVPKSHRVAIKFQTFDIENHERCNYDYVEIRDTAANNNHSSPPVVIGRFCGNQQLPDDIVSTGNTISIRFVSDKSAQKTGFSAIIFAEINECELWTPKQHGCQQQCINTLGSYKCACRIGYSLNSTDRKTCEIACGGELKNNISGILTSPGYPDVYAKSKECIWQITAPKHHRIMLNFTHFDLEGSNKYRHQDCNYDSLRIVSKCDNGDMINHGIYCGMRLPPLIVSQENVLILKFRSDETIQRSGFVSKFTQFIDECSIDNGGCEHKCIKIITGSFQCACYSGHILAANGFNCKRGGCNYEFNATDGIITSPNYPNNYSNNTVCVWNITTTPGHRIQIIFNYFQIESHQECAYDHLSVYNGNSIKGFILGRFCGNVRPPPVTTTSNQMYIMFKADSSGQKRGFSIEYSSVCGGHLSAKLNEKRTLYSHAKYGVDNYDHNMNCDWIIEADETDQNVQIHFDVFDLEAADDGNCSYDYVAIYDGYSNELLGLYCGGRSNQPLTTITSINESLIVRFQTDNTVTFGGFSASYISIETIDDNDEEYDDDDISDNNKKEKDKKN